jgi:serine/threonine protein kinase
MDATNEVRHTEPYIVETNSAHHSQNLSRHGFPHYEHPSRKYLSSWKIEQSGEGHLSMGNYYGYSMVVIKKMGFEGSATAFAKMGRAFHSNLIGLVEAFYDEGTIYFVYNYSGFSFSLSQVATTPSVNFSEPELANLCKGILQGLQFIHETLKIGHGHINGRNILLFESGDIKIGKSPCLVSFLNLFKI